MALSHGLIVFLILLGCLASVALLAAVLKPFRPEESLLRRNIPPEQAVYMRGVRQANLRWLDYVRRAGRMRPDTRTDIESLNDEGFRGG
ncbi:hypothetical protein BJY00DRAFT_311429 [Aspergillus carlsbadensis]|nr:hypothetical protein BJY00DRAFT_311429 [Aspergillus carlsbadensis]